MQIQPPRRCLLIHMRLQPSRRRQPRSLVIDNDRIQRLFFDCLRDWHGLGGLKWIELFRRISPTIPLYVVFQTLKVCREIIKTHSRNTLRKRSTCRTLCRIISEHCMANLTGDHHIPTHHNNTTALWGYTLPISCAASSATNRFPQYTHQPQKKARGF
ncbi:MAG: hypothetical protein CL920_31615 [Deltaproteobacteria bacterium]|nr:hypothetical protein [Deltaproteobacteria bacterium]MBK07315.1 hypothetical protein [Deltaproteobacteria bacterium]MBU53267.1 hypothetical protein [Deltaproteobacteria bacterium]